MGYKASKNSSFETSQSRMFFQEGLLRFPLLCGREQRWFGRLGDGKKYGFLSVVTGQIRIFRVFYKYFREVVE